MIFILVITSLRKRMKFPGVVAGFVNKNLKTVKCKLKEDVNFLDQQGIHLSVAVKIYFQTGYM